MKYIVDVTQLLHWSGNLTGIPRVMDELSLRFSTRKNENTIFIAWVQEIGEMCEVDFVQSRKRRGESIEYRTKRSLEKVIPSQKVTRKRRSTKQALKVIAHRSGISSSGIYKKVTSISHVLEAKNYQIYTPNADHKLFIPWGEWWDQDWLNKICQYQSVGVQVYPMCHDIIPMIVPQFSGNSSSLQDFITQVFPGSHKIIVQSDSTKRDLITWMKQKKLRIPNIEKFRLGEDFTIESNQLSDDVMTKKYDISVNDYLIYVSTIEPRKNHALLYYTYKLAASRGITLPKLLIIGRIGHDTSEIIKFISNDPQISSVIKICDYVSDGELDWLYQNCAFTVVPSFYEGWGMSVLESIARGKPAVCSNGSSLDEMPQDCVMYFNPASTDECLNAIQAMSNPKKLNQYLKHTAAYKPHSWDSSFSEIIRILGD